MQVNFYARSSSRTNSIQNKSVVSFQSKSGMFNNIKEKFDASKYINNLFEILQKDKLIIKEANRAREEAIRREREAAAKKAREAAAQRAGESAQAQGPVMKDKVRLNGIKFNEVTLSNAHIVLGLSTPTRNADLIKEAYKKLVRKYHPDLNPEKREICEEITKIAGRAIDLLIPNR